MRKSSRGVPAVIAVIASAAAAAQSSSDPVAEYERILEQTDGLAVYNDLVTRQIEAQRQELADLETAIAEVPTLERQLPALLSRMVEALEEFIRLDLPFYPRERAAGLTELRAMLERSDVTDADKVRRVLEAWQIEAEYGTSFTAYAGQLEIDGNRREVDFLQVGRIALLYQTTDEDAVTGAWDQASKAWMTLGAEHRNSVRQALRMARSQIAPEMVLLPIAPPEQ